jgi:DNA ligase (NAD+)
MTPSRIQPTNNRMDAKTAEIKRLAAAVTQAQIDFTAGRPTGFTDEEYDAMVDRLRDLDPANTFFAMIGAPVIGAEKTPLPIPLPSINKLKTQEEIDAWITKHPATNYQISAKLDGCSALWMPKERRLYTRGDGMVGRDISEFIPYFNGLIRKGEDTVVRGELIIRIGSPAVPAGASARNIVAGALGRKVADPALFAEIRFVAYELLSPRRSPCSGFVLLNELGYDVAISVAVPRTALTVAKLKTLFSDTEKTSVYKLDGLVIAPNLARPEGYLDALIAAAATKGSAVNPSDRMAWKTRVDAEVAATSVIGVEWNISPKGILAPVVLIEQVTLSDANINRATGINAKWIFDNGIGPGASVLIQRSGDVIPKIVTVYAPAPAGPQMPAEYTWEGVHIKPATTGAEFAKRQLAQAVTILGAEEVGPGTVAKLYDGGLTTIGALYAATPAKFQTLVSAKMAEKIHAGLRAHKHGPWTESTLMVASSTMPRGVGDTKLVRIFAVEPDVGRWSPNMAVDGVGPDVVREIMSALPAYRRWRQESGLTPDVAVAAAAAPVPTLPTVVFTGGKPPKEILDRMIAAGHAIGDTVKADTILVYDKPGSTKYKRAEAVGATMIPYDTFVAKFS